MNSIRVLTGLSDDFLPFCHYDSQIFPDDTAWYSLFEQSVSLGAVESRFYESRNESADDRVLLPLTRSSGRWGVVTLASMVNYYSVDYRPLCNTVQSRAQITPLIEHIIHTESPDILRLSVLDAEAPETGILEQAVRALGWRVFRETSQINWVHDVVGDFQGYMRSRPRRLQNTLRRKQARLKALPDMRVSIHDGREDLDEILVAYDTIYANSWKVPEPHQEFVPGLIRVAAKRGHLRLGLLTVADTPVAAHFWVVKHGRAYIYKLAHDQGYDKYSPGTVLMAEMIKHVLDHDAVRRLDFLSGDDQYKRDWMSERRKKVMICAYNPRSIRAQVLRLGNEHIKPFVNRLARFRSRLI